MRNVGPDLFVVLRYNADVIYAYPVAQAMRVIARTGGFYGVPCRIPPADRSA